MHANQHIRGRHQFELLFEIDSRKVDHIDSHILVPPLRIVRSDEIEESIFIQDLTRDFLVVNEGFVGTTRHHHDVNQGAVAQRRQEWEGRNVGLESCSRIRLSGERKSERRGFVRSSDPRELLQTRSSHPSLMLHRIGLEKEGGKALHQIRGTCAFGILLEQMTI